VMGSAGGPVGTVIGGVAGAVTGGAVGAAGDAVGAEATDSDIGRASSDTGSYGGTLNSSMGDAATRYRSRSYEVGGSTMSSRTRGDDMATRIENATERGIDADLDRDGDVGRSGERSY
jgi:hypothetical protein